MSVLVGRWAAELEMGILPQDLGIWVSGTHGTWPVDGGSDQVYQLTWERCAVCPHSRFLSDVAEAGDTAGDSVSKSYRELGGPLWTRKFWSPLWGPTRSDDGIWSFCHPQCIIIITHGDAHIHQWLEEGWDLFYDLVNLDHLIWFAYI